MPKLLANSFSWLGVTIWHFTPAKRGLVPSLSNLDLALRALMSVNWVWGTYSILTLAHDLSAIAFVGVLRTDHPEAWPPLFGNIAEVYTLRRFWGIFWHKLHVGIFDTYVPPLIKSIAQQKENTKRPWVVPICKALRAFWIFAMSAACHALANWVLTGKTRAVHEFRFFLSNYAVCLAETLAVRAMRRGGIFEYDKTIGLGLRLVGYAWVLTIIFCLTPAWQYPSVYASVGL